MDGIPGNFIDKKTGEALQPVFKWQDAMGIWQQKPIALCSWGELHTGYINLWNFHMQELTTPEVEEITFLSVIKILCYVFTVGSLLVAALVLGAMFLR